MLEHLSGGVSIKRRKKRRGKKGGEGRPRKKTRVEKKKRREREKKKGGGGRKKNRGGKKMEENKKGGEKKGRTKRRRKKGCASLRIEPRTFRGAGQSCAELSPQACGARTIITNIFYHEIFPMHGTQSMNKARVCSCLYPITTTDIAHA